MTRRRVAVVGSGVAGLTAAHILQRTNDVTIFEADDRLGGHAHTHDVGALAIDSGFIVHNDRTYPLLTRLFRELEVDTQASDMSMSVSCGGCGLEYAGGNGLSGVLAQRRWTGPYLRMLGDVPRFHRAARRALKRHEEGTLDEFATRFSRYFVAHYLTPLVSAIWSAPPAVTGRYPARYLFAFLANHGLLSITGSPRWRTVTGGSRTYVERVAKSLTCVSTSTPVRTLHRTATGITIRTASDAIHHFDAVVIATHPDQALRLLGEPTHDELAVLGAFRYSRNETVLHTHAAMLPRSPAARASWNYRMDRCSSTVDQVRITYDMNRLQRLNSVQRHLVTLGAPVPEQHVIARMVYEHPVYTPEAVAAQQRLPHLNTTRTAFAGAYHGWGFHEDGCRSGVVAAAALGSYW